MSAQMPDITPETNKDGEEEKKRSGVLYSLLSRLGLGSSGGLGSAAGGLGGYGAAGGMLATKAGIVALIVAGTTVAGTFAWMGHRYLGAGSERPMDGNFQSLFAPKPQSGASGGAQAGSASLASDSLQKFVDANKTAATDGAPDGSAQAGDAAAPSAPAGAGAAAGTSVSPPIASNNLAPKSEANPLAKFGMKKAELSKLGASSSGASTSASFSSNNAANNAALARTVGGKGGAGGAGGARAAGTGRGLAAATRRGGNFRGVGGAIRQAQNARSLAGNTGPQMDGSTSRAGIGGADAGIGGAGTGAGAGSGVTTGQPTSVSGDDKRFPESNVPTVAGKNVTPWQKAIQTATMLIAGAAMLLMVASKQGKENPVLAQVLAGVAALLGLAAVAIGSMIAGGKYGQGMQGNMFVLAGGLISVAAGGLIYAKGNLDGDGAQQWVKWLVYISGAGALAATMAGFMMKPKSYPAQQFNGGKPPDMGQYLRAPRSERAVERYAFLFKEEKRC
ncbi:MAG: hypothetical protein HY921_09255 [Elusimicrobia bacterium]|nr:hypothetical protein [Elusimicrobiota bacterium]